MCSTHLSIILLSFLIASSSMVSAASTPSFPDMTCGGSGIGTCTANDGYCLYNCVPDDAPFFTFGPVDETK
jgi:hypothetical protein